MNQRSSALYVVKKKKMNQRPRRSKKARNFYNPGHGADRGWVDGSSFPSFVRIKRCQYKALPSQLVRQKEIEEDSDATVLMEDDPSVDSPPATNYTNERKVEGVEGADRITGAIQEKIEGSVDLHESNNGSEKNYRNESLIASLGSPKLYTYELAFAKLDQLEMIAKSKEKAFLRDVETPDTSEPSAEEEPKNIRVQEVQKWITNAVRQTIFEHLNCGEIEEAVRKTIADRVAGWNWEIDLGEESPFVTQTNVVLSAAESVRGMECIATLQEMMEKQIVNAIDFEELEATAIGGYVMRK
jgi:hypothetical protein